FIAATEALSYWENDQFTKEIDQKAELINSFTEHVVNEYKELKAEKRGRGMMQGVACGLDGIAGKICEEACNRGLLMETSGPNDEGFKFLPPVSIDEEGLKKGFNIIEESIQAVSNK